MYIIIFLLFLIFLFSYTKGYFTNTLFKNNGFAKTEDPWIEPIIYENIVTPQEADYIIKTASKDFKDSMTIGGLDSSIRKSKTAWLYSSDNIVLGILQRVCNITGNPVENCEALQVVEYSPGGYYNQHHDSCCDTSDKCDTFIKDSGQRIFTMLIYLNDDFEGGETEFQNLNLKLKAPKYGGILFRPLSEGSSKCHPLALHSGTPVTSGIKYVCNVWIREAKF